MKHILENLLIMTVAILLVVTVNATDLGKDINSKSNFEVEKRFMDNTVTTLNNLSIANEYWSEAYLLNNFDKVNEFNQHIYKIIEEDIQLSTSKAAMENGLNYRAKNNARYANQSTNDKNSGNSFNNKKFQLQLDEKKRLFKQIRNTNAFVLKSALLEKYNKLLNDEIISYQAYKTASRGDNSNTEITFD